MATNPWTLAKTRAGMTGTAVAELITRTHEGPYVLMGHSLGARVMVTAAQTLATRPGPTRIDSMHLLGAAVGRKGHWHSLEAAVLDTVWNYWSENDKVLRRMYRLAEVGEVAVGQTGFQSTRPRIKDRNVSQLVPGHSAYVSKLPTPSVKHCISAQAEITNHPAERSPAAGGPYDHAPYSCPRRGW